MLRHITALFGKLNKEERGITGLETAIILIAFVTVAAVFGYSVLSAGLFSAERGKESIYSGLEQVRANMETVGAVICTSTDDTKVEKIKFNVKLALAGKPIDLTVNDGTGKNKTVISLKTPTKYYNDVKWTKAAVGENDGDDMLENNEQFEITLDLTDLGTNFTDPELKKNQTFQIQVKPSVGSSITIERTLPPAIEKVMALA